MKVKLPKVLHFGVDTYDVKVTKNMPNDFYGETENCGSRILIHPDQSKYKMRVTVVHEILHAVLHVAGIAKSLDFSHEQEERLVVTLAPWILGALRDNPELVDFLLEA